MESSKNKKPMTDSERAEMCRKMDEDLDKFMEELAAKKKDSSSTDEKKPFDFDDWCKEIDQHPAFMTDLKQAENGEYAETIQALQAMKYEEAEDEEDKYVAAERHKNEGNKHFKLEKYRWATDCYTQGLKKCCADRKLNSVLYANRATAQKYIGNLRTAVRDCVFARKFDPTNLKAIVRGAECLHEMGYGRQCLDWIESSKRNYEKSIMDCGIDMSETDKKQMKLLEEWKIKAVEAALVEERNLRKERVQERKEFTEKKKLLDALNSRSLNLKPKIDFNRPDIFEWSQVEVRLNQLHEHQRVDFDADGNLQWPLLVQYPEVGQTDVLTECSESVMVGVLMQNVLEQPADWDPEHVFRMDKISFFVSNEYDEHVMEVYPWTEFKEMFSYPGYQIKQGLPVLMVYTKDKVEKSFKPIGDRKFTIE